MIVFFFNFDLFIFFVFLGLLLFFNNIEEILIVLFEFVDFFIFFLFLDFFCFFVLLCLVFGLEVLIKFKDKKKVKKLVNLNSVIDIFFILLEDSDNFKSVKKINKLKLKKDVVK